MMKTKLVTLFLGVSLLFSGCKMSNTAKGGFIGAGAGAALGAGIGAIFGHGKGAVIGAAVGTAVGSGAGVLIGKKMDKQKAELEAIEGAKVEAIKDKNNLQAIKVTFASGILFKTGKSNLSTVSKNALTEFAASLVKSPDTDVTIYGHTDNTGSAAINERLSAERANSVSAFLHKNGVDYKRMKTEGKSYNEPVADNATVEGRRLNRRVEVYITANQEMIKKAEAEAKN